MKKILKRLDAYGLKSNKEKSILNHEKVDFIGYRISKDKITLTLRRGEAITNYNTPRKKREIRRFLEMTNYDRLFIPKYSNIAKPLYELFEDKTKFEWTDRKNKAFEDIKKNCSKELNLRLPNDKIKYTFETDASDVALGDVHTQEGLPIAYISRSLKKGGKSIR